MIPVMDDPMGKHWNQPKDIREAPLDQTHVILTKRQFDKLPEYSATNPSGVYPGKCWKRNKWIFHEDGSYTPTDKWFLCWYGIVDNRPDLCSNNNREIIVME